MGGGLMQLVAYGAQDVYLTGNPQITFFKVVYRRHTNFAMESIQQTFNGTSGFGKTVGATITKNGDLIGRMYLEHSVTVASGDYSPRDRHYGHALMKTYELEIGGQSIDKQYSQWLQCYNELTNPDYKNGGLTVLRSAGTATEYAIDTGNIGSDQAYTNTFTVVGAEAGDIPYVVARNSLQDMSGNIITSSYLSAVNTITYEYGTDTDQSGNEHVYFDGSGEVASFSTHSHRTVESQGNVIGDAIVFTEGSYQKMVCDRLLVGETGGGTGGAVAYRAHIPLQFWFCRSPGLALPMIALQYHDVKVEIEFEKQVNLFVTGTGNTFGTTQLWVDYFYLDTDERRRFAQVAHEYLIEQVQFPGKSSVTAATKKNVTLNFNHPVKELVWAVFSNTATTPCKLTQLTNNNDTSDANVLKLKLNGHERFAERKMTYFTRVQPYQHHTNTPVGDRIAVYSFALTPEEHQPSGTCNFSRIDKAVLEITPKNTGNLYVFALSYNVLRIMSGMAGLTYTN